MRSGRDDEKKEGWNRVTLRVDRYSPTVQGRWGKENYVVTGLEKTYLTPLRTSRETERVHRQQKLLRTV